MNRKLILIILSFFFITPLFATDEIIRPTGDGAELYWLVVGGDGIHYLTIDEVVTQPTAGDTSDYIHKDTTGPQTNISTSTLASVASVSQVIIWSYGLTFGSSTSVAISKDGTNWETEQLITTAGTVWNSNTFSVTWTIDGTFTLYTKYTRQGAPPGTDKIYTSYAIVTYIGEAPAGWIINMGEN